jgi:predicted Rossmann fold flavoprotein
MTTSIYDTVIVGAGAAGLMTAIQCARLGLNTLLLDGRQTIGAKILMSGGTRCNVTNRNVTVKDFSSNTPRVVRDVLSAYPSAKALDFFEKLGVKLISQDTDGKYFPSTNSAKTVLEALLREVDACNVTLKTGAKLKSARVQGKNFHLQVNQSGFDTKTMVLATGGLSYPTTGSDGSGYTIAKSFGHTLIETVPALTPFLTDDVEFKSLSGISVPARLSLKTSQKKRVVFEDALLFTHFGFSGPSALNISRHWVRESVKAPAQVVANFLPQLQEEEFVTEMKQFRTHHPKILVSRWLPRYLPVRLSTIIQKKTNIPQDMIMGQLNKRLEHQLLRNLFFHNLPITGVFGYKKAEVTAGGVDLKEVSSSTLESKKQQGLYLAGEILDVDGRIGGFNFQWSWSSGTVVARAIHKSLSA